MTVFSAEPGAPGVRSGDLPPLWERRWFGPAAVAAVALAMLAWTWGTWPDLLVDFGVQLYVPWRLAAGEVLYRDIAHYTGPLSVYYNALVFRIFGASLLALVLANLPVLGGIIAEIYYLCGQMAGRIAAIAASLSFVVLFAFARLMPIGNYNYVCPYEYDYTHGMLLCLGAVIFAWRLVKDGRWVDAAAAGLLTGLVFLTRAEFFVADIGAVGVGLFFFFMESRGRAGRIAAVSLSFLGAAIVPPVISALLLSMAMPIREALRGTAGMWPALLAGKVAQQVFYRHSMGLDDPGRSLRELAAWGGGYLAIIATAAIWARIAGKKWTAIGAAVAGLAGIGLVAVRWRGVDWISVFRPLPVVALAVAGWGIVLRLRRKSDAAALAGMVGTLSMLLMGKIFLYARIEHYGCWLAMPATMLLATAIFGWVCAGVKKCGGSAAVYLAGIGSLWAAVLCVHLAITGAAIGKLTVTVGSGGDEFLASDRGIIVNRAVALARKISPDQTLCCFPEGIMINYLSRRVTATPYVNFNPPDLLLFGESNMLTALRRRPPDYVMIVHKDTSEFGVRFFGVDYGRKLGAWIEANYKACPVALDLGSEPLRDDRFGIRLLAPARNGASLARLAPGGEKFVQGFLNGTAVVDIERVGQNGDGLSFGELGVEGKLDDSAAPLGDDDAIVQAL